MIYKRLISILLASAGLITAVGSAAGSDPDYWYVTGSGGVLIDSQLGESDVTLSKTQHPIKTLGNFEIGGEQAFAFTLGRHLESDAESPAWRKRPVRFELEYWGGNVKRNFFTVRILEVPLDDSIQARAIFVNGAVRLWSRASHSLWFGAGIGDAKVKMPGAANISCECLYAAKGSGISYRLKLNYEHAIGARSAWFIDLGHVWLPPAHTSQDFPAYSSHGELRTLELRIGLKIAI